MNELTPTVTSIYDYSGPQRKMLRIYDLLRDSLRFEKYYAFLLKRYKFWNLIGDASIAISASGSFASAEFIDTPIGKNLLAGTLVFSILATILRPVLKLNDRIVCLAKLQVQYLELYQDFNTLKCEIQETDCIQPKHEKQLSILTERFNKLGLQNDPGESGKLMSRFQSEVESHIPNVGLWLPANAIEEPLAESMLELQF